MIAGVRLGWLINPKNKTVEIYRQGQSPEILEKPMVIAEGSVLPGFSLSLDGYGLSNVPKTGSERCRRCAKLSLEQAIALHGPDGTGCWEGSPCHKRRSYYKNRDRYNKQRRKQYRVNQGNCSR